MHVMGRDCLLLLSYLCGRFVMLLFYIKKISLLPSRLVFTALKYVWRKLNEQRLLLVGDVCFSI